MIAGLVFDVDDTLYDERDYVRSGFSHVATMCAMPDLPSSLLERWLLDAFEAGVRGHTFGQMLQAFPALATRSTEEELVAAYRAHEPAIRLASDVAFTLDELKTRPIRLAILTDGPTSSQRSKVQALGLERWFEPILLTEPLGPRYRKPGTAGFELIGQTLGLAGSSLAYVADNPTKDFAGPRRLGWMTIRLRHPRQLRSALEPVDGDHAPDIEVADVSDLLGLPELGGSERGRAGPPG